MSKLDELRAKVEAMTPGEWVHGGWQYVVESLGLHWTEIAPDESRDDDARITVAGSDPTTLDTGSVIGGCGCCGSPSGRKEDATGIVALRNAAPALLDLADAVKAWRDQRALNLMDALGSAGDDRDNESIEVRRARVRRTADAARAVELALDRLEDLP